MRETAEVTSVADAFDDGDLFDLHLSLTFHQRVKTANIRRETTSAAAGLSTGGFTASQDIARFTQATSMAIVGADIGIWKDLAAVVRLPIILSDTRELGDLNGSQNDPNRLLAPSGAPLFTVPFSSPNRSGLDFIEAGLDYGIFNQQRNPNLPTWVVGLRGRFGIGPPLRPCFDKAPAGGVRCPSPNNPLEDGSPGITRAMNGLVAQTMFSHRSGDFEPFLGLDILAEFPQNRGVYGESNTTEGALLNRPPVRGTIHMGVEYIPWQRKDQFRRLVLQARVFGTYVSPGRDYSELFDALGTSQEPSLRQPNPGDYTRGPDGSSVADTSKPSVYFGGVTDMQAHAVFGGRIGVVWQAGEYIKFGGAFGLAFAQNHLITAADACNPNFADQLDRTGPCRSQSPLTPITGIPNPNHRTVIDTPGGRFSADGTTIYDFALNGTLMF
jgi:hypothetical protein